MKIAIIAPSPVPFTIGGAETLYWGLLRTINQGTPHHVELVKLPSPEGDFWSLIESYRRFAELDLSHFDMVISTKYPSWMVLHPNHNCYMLHRLRGLYDTYHFAGLPLHYGRHHPSLAAMRNFMKSHEAQRESLPEFFDLAERLKKRTDVPSEAFSFPGPIIREVIHYLDGIGLSPRNVSRYAAISHNVANRMGYFPPGAEVSVIYPPSNLPAFRDGNMDYLFTVSRLENHKRIHLLIEAMKHVRSSVELRIAGTGEDEQHLKEMAKDDPRVVFLGFVNDTELIDAYADALAVLFVPYDEDYGLITIEAMMSGKPVITTTDSGEPNEFVKNGETGFSVPPDPIALARQIDYLCKHREKARSMGATARHLVRNITWENTVSQLLNPANRTVRTPGVKKRKKITLASTFPVFPPRGGGQSRIFHLYRNVARHIDVELVTITGADASSGKALIAPNLREIRIPKSAEHHREECMLEQSAGGIAVTDVAMPQLYHLTPDYVEALRESAGSADYVVASHPYLLHAIREVSDKPLWYEAHNVETALKKTALETTPTGRRLLEATREVESACCRQSSLIMVCADRDGETLHHLYQADRTKIVEVPNGVDLDSVTYVSPYDRIIAKRRLGIDRAFLTLFIGSWHGPNIEAARKIFHFAEALPEVRFLIAGSVGMAFRNHGIPANVGLTGEVDDATKGVLLSISDVALNPMETGSGTNLKMLDYCAAGIPVISTLHGARGLMLKDGNHIQIAAYDRFPDAIQSMRRVWRSLEQRIEKARECVVSQYDWAIIAQNFIKVLKKKGLL